MTKILFVTHTVGIGGSGFAMLNIIRNLDKSKYIPIVFIKRKGKLSDELLQLGIEVHFLPTLNQVPYNVNFQFSRKHLALIKQIIQSAYYLYDWLKWNHIDVFYLNSMMLYPYLLSAKKNGIKTIIHIRENWPEEEHRIQRNCAINSILKYADEIVAINTFSANMFSITGKHITVVYDWIDFSNRYKPMPFDDIFHEDCRNLKVFLFLGGFNPIKGGKQVISTFVNCLLSSDYRLLVVGDLNSLDDDYILDLIKSDKRIKCIPPMYEIKDLVEQSFCMLSYFTMPHANLGLAESIVLKTPVVAAKTPESLEYSLNGQLAQLFPLGDLNSFVNAIESTIQNYDCVIEKLHKHSSEVALMFNKDSNLKRLENAIDGLLTKLS